MVIARLQGGLRHHIFRSGRRGPVYVEVGSHELPSWQIKPPTKANVIENRPPIRAVLAKPMRSKRSSGLSLSFLARSQLAPIFKPIQTVIATIVPGILAPIAMSSCRIMEGYNTQVMFFTAQMLWYGKLFLRAIRFRQAHWSMGRWLATTIFYSQPMDQHPSLSACCS